MRYYQDGGVVSPELNDEQNKQLMGFLGNPAMRQAQAMDAPNTAADAQSKIADSHPGLKLGAPSTPPAGGGNPPLPPTDSQPDALTADIKGREAQVDKFGPEKQAALMQHLQQGYKSPGNLIAKGGATLADAIMQGVARAGSSGNLAAINERENANLNRAAEMGKSLQEQNLAGGKRKEELEQMSPATPLGASNAPAIQAVASMYKMSPQQVEALMKSNPQTALKLLDQVGQYAAGQMKAQIEQKMKLLEIEVQKSLGQQGKNIEGQRVRNEALKETANHPILHPINAWKANQTMAGEVNGQPQKISSRAEFDALPSGSEFIDDSGKVKTKK